MGKVNSHIDKVAVVAGTGDGLGAALCLKLLDSGYLVAGLSRSATPKPELGDRYLAVACDLTDEEAVNVAITKIETAYGEISVYIHNAAYLFHSNFLETSAEDFTDLWGVVCRGAIHGFQRVVPNMLKAKSGTILAIGATASVRAGAGFSAFSSAKFALRGLAQSLAREYSPQGIPIAHVIIDGAVWGKQAISFGRDKKECLLPQAIAETCLNLIHQHRSAWTHELELRPDVETF